MRKSGDLHSLPISQTAQPDCGTLSHPSTIEIPVRNQSAADKKPYRRPTYRFERVLETMALSCGKVAPVEFQCRFNRKNS
jgi:hypothetical protein